jgi:hypothetical protein
MVPIPFGPNSMAPKFEEYSQVVDNYAKFLDATVTNFDSAKFQINSNASAIKKGQSAMLVDLF